MAKLLALLIVVALIAMVVWLIATVIEGRRNNAPWRVSKVLCEGKTQIVLIRGRKQIEIEDPIPNDIPEWEYAERIAESEEAARIKANSLNG